MVHVRTALCLVKSFHCTESKRGMHGLFYTHHRFGIFSLLPVTSSRLGCPHSHSMENVNNDTGYRKSIGEEREIENDFVQMILVTII